MYISQLADDVCVRNKERKGRRAYLPMYIFPMYVFFSISILKTRSKPKRKLAGLPE